MVNKQLRQIPAIHELLQEPSIVKIIENDEISNDRLKSTLQEIVANTRETMVSGKKSFNNQVEIKDYIIRQVIMAAKDYLRHNLQPVINGTGTVLHTNLGRARLSKSVVDHVVNVSQSYSTLEYNISQGERGSRHDIVESYLTELTGAEAAMVVNNNAASVFMILSALAKGFETIVSRGELVEIGGSFRVSSIMEESGAILKEVGTTNKTHLYDFKEAISEQTNMLMKVHTSNFHIEGFTASVNREDLAELASKHNLIYYEDLGSGLVYDLNAYQIGREPLVHQVIQAGVDLVSFSGDKLLGGPQAGIIVGKKKWIDQLKKHQLARVLRVDKMSYAALEETLRLILLNNNQTVQDIPTLRDTLRNQDVIRSQVNHFIDSQPALNHLQIEVGTMESQVGGGTLPNVVLPSYGIKLYSEEAHAHQLSEWFRRQEPPVIVRVQDDKIFIDFRTITTDEDALLRHAIHQIDKLIEGEIS
ncbi:L-seryl-tRNA(Sec) selenium transferase [Alkalibacillus aidingensis]|uniref:L-seryl-tRNA(Sec) selenium transferase n=1 Tax=Alkalibacillus aidingensis TaxID=2747607 RepID=UPI00166009FA|nr:L-seryl-tRNA(Sec) selenium transferase [Alkalibacillus aidingensis]